MKKSVKIIPISLSFLKEKQKQIVSERKTIPEKLIMKKSKCTQSIVRLFCLLINYAKDKYEKKDFRKIDEEIDEKVRRYME